jgi:hypothetical protein
VRERTDVWLFLSYQIKGFECFCIKNEKVLFFVCVDGELRGKKINSKLAEPPHQTLLILTMKLNCTKTFFFPHLRYPHYFRTRVYNRSSKISTVYHSFLPFSTSVGRSNQLLLKSLLSRFWFSLKKLMRIHSRKGSTNSEIFN